MIEFNKTHANDFAEFETEMERRSKRLKPAKNVRLVRPRVCAFCKFYHIMDGFSFCERSGGFSEDAGDMMQYMTTCDGWTEVQS